jgi:hypothetical protein
MEKNFQGVMNNHHVEDSIDSIVKRLEAQGKKFKIVYEDEESEDEDDDNGEDKFKTKKKKKSKKRREEVKEEDEDEEESSEEAADETGATKKHRKPKENMHSSVDFSKTINEISKLGMSFTKQS